jgi:pyruvate formate lyase activating enzyme
MDLKLSEKVGNSLKCNLCPHFCVLKKDEIGKCRARHSDGEKISHVKLGAISSLAVESIEKKPFKKFLSGTKTLTGGGYSCSLFCKYCENVSISQKSPPDNSKILSPLEIVNIAIKKHCKSVSLSYNEPTVDYEHLISLAKESALNGLLFVLKTNAFVNKEPWREICKVTAAMNIDLKAGNKKNFKDITGCSQYVTKDRIKEAYDYGVHIEVSIPLYYSDQDLCENINEIGMFLSSVDKEIPCHLLSIQPSHKYDSFIFNSENLKISEKILSQYMNNIYIVV